MNINKDTDNIVINDTTLNQFGDYAAGFLQSLANKGYAAATINQYRCFIHALAGTMHAKGVVIQELNDAGGGSRGANRLDNEPQYLRRFHRPAFCAVPE